MDKKIFSDEEIQDALKQLSKDNVAGSGADKKFPVLVIDDDKWMQRIFDQYLSEWGFKAIAAYDPYQGIAAAIKHRPLLIFLDIVMPEVSGEVLLKMLKEIEITADIPVIIISGNLNPELLSSTYKEGAAGFISKPFSQQVLYDRIRQSLTPAGFGETV